jgi:drug/metabolite transporter (DMT)-like permease
LIFEPTPRPSLTDLSLVGLFSLTFGSTLIAFAFQVKAQKILSPSVVSLLFLLEAPFATFFGLLFLGEELRSDQWLGAALILSTSVVVSLRSARSNTE